MKIIWKMQGFYDVRRAPGVVAELESHAERIATTANANGKGTYATGSRQGARKPRGRWRASVVTADAQSMLDNAKNNTLVRSM